MRIALDRRSSTPIYLQIRDRIRHLIQSGSLPSGERLPSVRSLANSIQVNKLTVIEAYGVLEADGLVNARQGAGYFVNRVASPLSKQRTAPDPVQEVVIPERSGSSYFDLYITSLQAQRQGGIIDFSSGFYRPTGLEDLTRIARRAMGQITDTLFSYDFPQGQLMLRQQIAQMLLVQLGLDVDPDHLIITNGSKQGLSLALHYYVKPGDWVITESPTFHGALPILNDLGARAIGIPMRNDGMNLELLEQYLRSHHPKLIYTISTLHNPTGITTSIAHRQKLLSLAEQYECQILEDNAYEGLNFEPAPPPIKALDRYHLVTYTGTFSKTLMPGLRLGYMVITGDHYRPLLEKKLLHDIHVSTVSQGILSEYLASGHYRHHLNHLRSLTQQRQNVMLGALEHYMPKQVRWTVPKGGVFLWAQFPDHIPLQEVRTAAAAQHVLIGSSNAFFPGGQGYQALRLNFAQKAEDIEKGISILGDIVRSYK